MLWQVVFFYMNSSTLRMSPKFKWKPQELFVLWFCDLFVQPNHYHRDALNSYNLRKIGRREIVAIIVWGSQFFPPFYIWLLIQLYSFIFLVMLPNFWMHWWIGVCGELYQGGDNSTFICNAICWIVIIHIFV